ncbi:MAG: hypothetical protein IPK21_13745 [Haliscomenobacter sp.]|nr:hypothetical protein [Haliscomenobacter sp.]
MLILGLAGALYQDAASTPSAQDNAARSKLPASDTLADKMLVFQRASGGGLNDSTTRPLTTKTADRGRTPPIQKEFPGQRRDDRQPGHPGNSFV